MRPNFDPHLRDGFDDIPAPRPTLGQHDRIARGAAARGAVLIGEEEDAIDDEEGLGARPLVHNKAAGRALQEADTRGADVVDRARQVRGRRVQSSVDDRRAHSLV